MNYLSTINAEFVKEARNWDDLTLEEQKGYLSRHPRSKRRLTAKPGSKKDQTQPEHNAYKLTPENIKKKICDAFDKDPDSVEMKDGVGVYRDENKMTSYDVKMFELPRVSIRKTDRLVNKLFGKDDDRVNAQSRDDGKSSRIIIGPTKKEKAKQDEEKKVWLKKKLKAERKLKKEKGKYNVNRLTPAGINKRIRAKLGLADQYSDVNARMAPKTIDGVDYKVIHSLQGESKGKLKKVINELFGTKNERVSVNDESQILIAPTKKEQAAKDELDKQHKTKYKAETAPLEKAPDSEYVKDVLNNSMSEVWLDSQVDKMENTLKHHFPKKKKKIDEMIELAGDASTLREEMDRGSSTAENKYYKKSERVLKMIDNIMGEQGAAEDKATKKNLKKSHTAQINVEFVKLARKWEDMSLEDQKGYLKRHPKSKRKLTAKPSYPERARKPKKKSEVTDKLKKTKVKQLSGQLDNVVSKFNKQLTKTERKINSIKQKLKRKSLPLFSGLDLQKERDDLKDDLKTIKGDIKDAEKIQSYLNSGDISKAEQKYDKLDTAADEVYPRSLRTFFNKYASVQKEARDWDDLTLEEQKGYLSRHPKSKRKITAKPETKVKMKDVQAEKVAEKNISLYLDLTRKIDRYKDRDPNILQHTPKPTKKELAFVDKVKKHIYKGNTALDLMEKDGIKMHTKKGELIRNHDEFVKANPKYKGASIKKIQKLTRKYSNKASNIIDGLWQNLPEAVKKARKALQN